MKKINQNIFLFSSMAIGLLITRMLYTEKITYIFLVWNLFLAYLPFLISKFIFEKEHLSKIELVIYGSFWLLLFPNAPYIITDFIHLKTIENNLVWLDITLLLLFAFTGLYMGVVSLYLMRKKVEKMFSLKAGSYFLFVTVALASFGIYLGRIQRWNSWDIVHQPFQLFKDILSIFISPTEHPEAYLITGLFSVIILVSYKMFGEKLTPNHH